MAPIILVGLAAAGWMWLKGSAKTAKALPAASHDPLDSIPAAVSGPLMNAGTKVKGGRKYTVKVGPVEKNGKQFAIAQLQGSTSWLSYWHDTKTKARKFVRGYAPGNKTQSGVVMSYMMSDWNVKR